VLDRLLVLNDTMSVLHIQVVAESLLSGAERRCRAAPGAPYLWTIYGKAPTRSGFPLRKIFFWSLSPPDRAVTSR
jgi:hypothetical protein